FRRLFERLFGATVTPGARGRGRALDLALDQVVRTVGRAPVDARIDLRGLRPVVVAGRAGISIDRAAARRQILARFAGLDRDAVVLPLSPQQPQTTAAMLTADIARVRTAVSAPVDLAVGRARYRLQRWQLATMLRIPQGDSHDFTLGGKEADAFFT